MRNYCILFLCIASLSFVGCVKDSVPFEEQEKGYYFFPTDSAHFVEYDIDSIYYDTEANIKDTFYYQLREEIGETIVDNEGRASQKLYRYKRLNNTLSWQLSDVWVITLTGTRAEKVEENVRIVKLVFPVKTNTCWNGNLYNTNKDQDYCFKNNIEAKMVNGFNFEVTQTVEHEETVNLVERKQAFEVYAKEVGLVQKQDINLQTKVSGEIIKGYELYWKITNYGPQ